MKTDPLAERADEYTRLLTDVAADEHGILLACAHFDEMRPLRDDDLPPQNIQREGSTPAGFFAYEDAGMTTGAFLSSQSLRFSVTGETGARSIADQTYAAIRHIYELGREKQEGFFPKPYNGRTSDQVSRDQYIFIVNGMAAYRHITDDARAREAKEMIAHMAAYWVDINYTDSYFGLPASNHLDDVMGSLFLGLIYPAATIGQDSRLATEYKRLLTEEHLGERMKETLRDRFRQGKTYDGGTYFRQNENSIMMKSMAVDSLWEGDVENRPLWREALEAFRDDDLTIALDEERRLTYWVVGYDPATDSTFMTEPGILPELENPLDLPQLTWGGLRKTPGSTQVAYAAAVIGHRLGDASCVELARSILDAMDLPAFRGDTVPSPEHHVPGNAWHANLLQTNYLAYWLWTYWLGRSRDLW